MKFYQFGRSMVEMLGVLAIIGVLSVGAIAGYSKAMFKYRLNKQTEQLNTLISAVTETYRSLINYGGNKSENIIPYLKKLNYIPKEMLKNEDEDFIYDSFGNQYLLRTYNSSSWMGTCGAGIDMYSDLLNDQSSREICQNILRTVKEYHSLIWYTEVTSIQEGSTNTGVTFAAFNGTLDYEYYPYLKDIPLSELYEACHKATETDGSDRFAVRIWWKGC